ncbi:ComEA family DNA-binding protein [Methylobacterium oxalidis]|uniref:ComEA family DNA-binding protein n=1 Tax=Methylobacterium oxalidis TaxID=944322 RepID=UPI003315F55A
MVKRPVRTRAVLISALLGLGAVGLVAATAPQLTGRHAPEPLRGGSAMRAPLPLQPSGGASVPPAGPADSKPPPLFPAVPMRLSSDTPADTSASSSPLEPSSPPRATGLLSLNTASLQELRRLPLISKARARAIVKGRPYGSVSELASKKIISAKAYRAIKSLVDVH